jgi:predicted ATP-grasp superfamily ATP-dependent carboligase
MTWKPGDAVPQGVEGRVMVKPRLHSEPGARVLRRPVDSVPDAASARDAVARIEKTGGAALLQEHVTGTLVAWSGLVDREGALVAALQQEACRTHPPGVGVTSRGITVAVSPDLTAKAVRLLRDLSWTGLVQLQFIVPEDRCPRLVDLNARCYGSMALAVAAGVNFPALWAAVATGRPVARVEPALGTRYQWLEGDVRSAWRERRGGLAHDLGQALRWSLRSHHSIWQAGDPLPALAAAGLIARRMTRRATGSGAG